MAGIGCHGMALSIPSRRTATITHMGAEGANWIGQAPFTNEQHIFQNLGDGTYTHSGLLALRAAAVSGVNITYKILYNDAVAMTGGQPAEGGFTVAQIAHQVWAEGTKRLAIVSDDPDKYPANYFPPGATVHHRRDLDAVQRELREIKGLTVLIYDQTCAAEKRRRRKRGLYPDPPKRVFINDLVCEGCGDCSQTSNCVSVQPLDTEFGRKRQIDQSNCNKDYSCVEGFCPSFVTVHGGSLKRLKNSAVDSGQLFADLPLPAAPALDKPYNILVTGIGGTGVITVGALLGMAAHVDGKGCSALDFTGLSQKNGAVMSHVRIAAKPEDLSTVRITNGGADLILGCDMVVSAGTTALCRVDRGVDQGLRQRRSAADRELRAKPRHRFRAGRDADHAARRHRRAQSRDHRCHRHRRDADGRQHRDQSLHARLRLPEGRDPAVAGGAAPRHRDQRRRDRDEQAGLHLGPARRARHVAHQQRAAVQEPRRRADEDARRADRAARRFPDGAIRTRPMPTAISPPSTRCARRRARRRPPPPS